MSTVSPAEIRTDLRKFTLCRCKYWVVCNEEHCYHYEPHAPNNKRCVFFNPVKYCSRVKGFVYCTAITGMDDNYECDPNLAFKAKRDAEKRDKAHGDGWNSRRRDDGDDFF